METVEFSTPSGHKVYLRPYLTYAEKRELRKIYGNYMSLDAKASEANTAVNGRAVFEAEEYALKCVIVRMVATDGKVYEGVKAYEAIMASENEADGDAIISKVNEITSAKQLSEDDKKNRTRPL